jgi:hypothetical protein
MSLGFGAAKLHDSLWCMSPRIRRLLTVSASIVIGATGGVLLGNFALSGIGERPVVTGAEELRSLAGNLAAAPVSTTRDLAPDRYVCEGCDASPVNEAALADDWRPFDSTPLPAYQPEQDSRPAVRLPVLAADRVPTRPDVPAAVKAVPVLAADGASGGNPAPSPDKAAPPAP